MNFELVYVSFYFKLTYLGRNPNLSDDGSGDLLAKDKTEVPSYIHVSCPCIFFSIIPEPLLSHFYGLHKIEKRISKNQGHSYNLLSLWGR